MCVGVVVLLFWGDVFWFGMLGYVYDLFVLDELCGWVFGNGIEYVDFFGWG